MSYSDSTPDFTLKLTFADPPCGMGSEPPQQRGWWVKNMTYIMNIINISLYPSFAS